MSNECETCGRSLVFPGIFNLSGTIKVRTGVVEPRGHCTFDCAGVSFCDLDCFEEWIQHMRSVESGGYDKVAAWDRSGLDFPFYKPNAAHDGRQGETL
jgi:hypothetical protein